MRKIISILLTLTFVLYLGGMQATYWIKMAMCKQESYTLIQSHTVLESNTVAFSFTPSEYSSLSWSERNKEFTYKGQRYDIMGIHYFSDEITVKCYSDKDETNLADAFSGFIKKMFSSPQHNNDNNTDITSKIYKEYLPTKLFEPIFYVRVLTSIHADCVLVDTTAMIDVIWHPPALV